MDPEKEAKTFVENYYKTFDSDPAALAIMYQEGSMLTFAGQKIQGSQDIVAKLTSLPYEQCKHAITTVDCQPCGPAGGMLVFVNGDLQLDGQQQAVKFSQVFPQTPNEPYGMSVIARTVFVVGSSMVFIAPAFGFLIFHIAVCGSRQRYRK
ncbi:Nuclear transport factor 2 [Morella rubra]|uniref:NTF2-related export protein n=1 Tax=Morella rubra TaxID=262757 RepID=A0A6A1VP13_9ROSI|nr:Nuclear transport factor 2 [Morella rubra]